jgi:hypothetical protein
MTKITSVAAVALVAVLVAGFEFAPAIAKSFSEIAMLDGNHAAPMTASQKTRGMMPAAHWKGCGA